MDRIQVQRINEVYMRVTAEPHIEQELSDFFKFDVPAAKFMPQFRKRAWNGFIFLYSKKTKLIYNGLLEHLKLFCEERNIQIEYLSEFNSVDFTQQEAEKFITALQPTRTPRDYQLDAFIHCVRNHRALILSPTGSGKSFIIYLLARLYTLSKSQRKFLIIVPTISLVHQMASDFVSYGYDINKIHKITAGESKDTDKPIIISTWQSIFSLHKTWFNQFKAVVIDEAHQAKAKSLTGIMTKLINCKYRFGFTGTLDNVHCNKLIIEGLTGPVHKVISTKELIDRQQLADLEIKILVLKYNQETKKIAKDFDYQTEMDFLVQNEDRNKFIKNLVLSLKGNTLVLYQYVEKHGKVLFDQINNSGKSCYFIHGGVEGEDREEIRQIVDSGDNNIIVASYGTYSTGINIVNLNNIVFASPSKSKVRILQSIGRGLRVSKDKKTATLYDIADDLTYNGKRNYTLNHLFERVKNYNEERLPYKIYNIETQTEPYPRLEVDNG
jgi:superfamily II DNA or RNA helicase